MANTLKPKKKEQPKQEFLFIEDNILELPMFSHMDVGRMLKGDAQYEPVDAPEFVEEYESF